MHLLKWLLYDRDLNHERVNGALSGLRQFLPNESPLKMMENAFYFILKLFWFSRYLNFCLDILVM